MTTPKGKSTTKFISLCRLLDEPTRYMLAKPIPVMAVTANVEVMTTLFGGSEETLFGNRHLIKQKKQGEDDAAGRAVPMDLDGYNASGAQTGFAKKMSQMEGWLGDAYVDPKNVERREESQLTDYAYFSAADNVNGAYQNTALEAEFFGDAPVEDQPIVQPIITTTPAPDDSTMGDSVSNTSGSTTGLLENMGQMSMSNEDPKFGGIYVTTASTKWTPKDLTPETTLDDLVKNYFQFVKAKSDARIRKFHGALDVLQSGQIKTSLNVSAGGNHNRGKENLTETMTIADCQGFANATAGITKWWICIDPVMEASAGPQPPKTWTDAEMTANRAYYLIDEYEPVSPSTPCMFG